MSKLVLVVSPGGRRVHWGRWTRRKTANAGFQPMPVTLCGRTLWNGAEWARVGLDLPDNYQPDCSRCVTAHKKLKKGARK